MAKKKNHQNISPGNIKNTATMPKHAAGNTANKKTNRASKFSLHIWIAAGIGVITWLVLKVVLSNQFTNWDDPGYIQDNPIIKDLTAAGLKHLFSEPVMGNYHPLTILTYSLEYSKVQFEPWLYHFDNLALHLLDTLLVYWLVLLLSKRTVAAMVTALLFGLHPMHTESVAWISGRKDVLYSLFYLGSCIAYMYYTQVNTNRKWGWYAGIVILFLFSLLSKPSAVTLPLSLLLIDYLCNRTWSKIIILEKIPLFILSIVFGIIALKAQHSAGAMDMIKVVYSPLERIALGGYALITYLWKAILPVHQCNYYPYPPKVNGHLPLVYYLYPATVTLLIFMYRKYVRKNRIITFGFLFFIANIILLLQFIPVGDAILADRYSYIPYLGLFYIVGWGISGFFVPNEIHKLKYPVTGVCALYFCCLCYWSNQRCQVWEDPISLWRDEIEKEPVKVTIAYNNLGYIYAGKCAAAQNTEEKKVYYDSAHYLLNKAIELQPDFVNPYISLGDLERNTGHYEEARNNYYRIMKYKNKEPNVYAGLAILYYVMKNTDSAGFWFRAAIQINSSPESHSNYGNFLNNIGSYDSAIVEYGIAIKSNPLYYVPYMNQGESYKGLKQWDKAQQDFDQAAKLSPETGEIYYRRSFCFSQKGDKATALQDVDKAISLGFGHVDSNYYTWLKSK